MLNSAQRALSWKLTVWLRKEANTFIWKGKFKSLFLMWPLKSLVFFSTNKTQNAWIYLNPSYTHCSTSIFSQLSYIMWRFDGGKTNSLAKWWHFVRISAVYNWKNKTNVIKPKSVSCIYRFTVQWDGTDKYPPFHRYLKIWKCHVRVAPQQMNALWHSDKNQVALAILVLKKIWWGTLNLCCQFFHSFFHTQNPNSNKCII